MELALRDGPRARAIRAGVDVVRAEQHARRTMPNPSVSSSREGAGLAAFLQVEQPIPFWRTRAALTRAGVAAIDAAEKVSVDELKEGLSVVVDARGDSLKNLAVVEVRIVPAPAPKQTFSWSASRPCMVVDGNTWQA